PLLEPRLKADIRRSRLSRIQNPLAGRCDVAHRMRRDVLSIREVAQLCKHAPALVAPAGPESGQRVRVDAIRVREVGPAVADEIEHRPYVPSARAPIDQLS